ncbi:MAG: accessory gene regulator B family protein [Oscillospiraceae bacterium]
MITETSKKISKYLISNGADESDEDVLAYGAECLINLLISDGLLLVIGVFTHHILYLLVWSVGYSVLRLNLGGLHASSHFWCILIGTAIGASSMVISRFWVSHTYITIISVVLAVIIAIVIAPVPHKHKQHLQKQRRKIKYKVTATLIGECIAIVIFYFVDITMASYIVSGLIMATTLAIFGVLFNPR